MASPPTRRAGTQRPDPTRADLRLRRTVGERVWVLHVPFDSRGYVNAYGARWDSSIKATIFVGAKLPSALRPYAAPDFSWERWIEDDLNGVQLAPQTPSHTMVARPHQLQAANAIANAAARGYRGFLEADDVGVGKTLAAIEGVKRVALTRPVEKVLIVCPLSVVPHWRRVIAAAGDGGLRWVVINYDRIKHLLTPPPNAADAKKLSTRNRRIARNGNPKVNFDVIVCDESHRLRHATAQRSQAMTRIARWDKPTREAPFVIWMSATAGQDPTELSYLAPLLMQATGSTAASMRDFGAWLAAHGFHVQQAGRAKTWTWTDNPRERHWDINKMKGLLFADPDPVAIRRLPTDIAGWPQIQRTLMPVDLTIMEWQQYQAAWTEFRAEMNLLQRGRDPQSALAAQMRFRQKASLIRVNATVEHVKDALANGRQVGVSTAFVETADQIRTALTAAKIPTVQLDGTNRWNREDQRLRFQTGAAHVAVFTLTEGISLHAGEQLPDGTIGARTPRILLAHDVRYSGIDTLQIEGRLHRDGQFAPVTYLYASGTVEERITRTVISRVESTKAMVGDDTTLIRQLSALLNGNTDS